MSADPLVSVVIPAYNAEKTIRFAIDSVLEQTVQDLEVVVVDDASTDGTAKAVEAVGDSRVRLLKSPRNLRQAAARNLGMKEARGRWVAFVDADDEWVPERLEHLLAAIASEPECFVADFSTVCVPKADGRLAPLESQRPAEDLHLEEFDFPDYVELGMDVKPMVPRAALTGHGIEFPEWGSCGDWAFLIARLSASGIKGKLLHRVGYLYRVTGAHDSSTVRGIEEILKVTEFLAVDPNMPEATKERLKRQIPGTRKRLVGAALREGNWAKFGHYARQSPSAFLELPGSLLRFLWRRIRYSTVHRSSASL
jgi:succinoglycan biosynthesis protein ExoO